MRAERYLIETPYYSKFHGFRPKTQNFDFGLTSYHMKGYEEQNDTNNWRHSEIISALFISVRSYEGGKKFEYKNT